MPRVAINGGMPVIAMMLPLIAPASSPTPSPATTGIHTGKSVNDGNTARLKSEVCARLAATIADAFQKGITRIELEVFAANERAFALYRKFGFVEEGRKRHARCLDGNYDDSICMALLKAEAPPATRSVHIQAGKK